MILQGGLTVGHRAHNPKIGGSIPPPVRKIVLVNMKNIFYHQGMKNGYIIMFPNGSSETISCQTLKKFASSLGLDKIAPNRYSNLFVLDLYIWNKYEGHEPFLVINEIKILEKIIDRIETKKASKFHNPPLKGLWHKHFFDAHYIAQNLLNNLNQNFEKDWKDIFKDDPIISPEKMSKFVSRITREALETKAKNGKLTGEWIIFAKHKGQNFYLSLGKHTQGDDVIFKRIKDYAFPQFPFLDSSAKESINQ